MMTKDRISYIRWVLLAFVAPVGGCSMTFYGLEPGTIVREAKAEARMPPRLSPQAHRRQ